MSIRLLIAAILLCVSVAAASPPFLLGVDYSTQAGVFAGTQITTDAQGAAYILANNSSLLKFSSAGERVWQDNLGFTPAAIAADASGNVYSVPSSGAAFVAKVNSGGPNSATRLDLGSGLTAAFVTVDTNNRVWVAGSTIAGVDNPLKTTDGAYQRTLPNTTRIHGFIARLNTTGTAIEYATYLAGSENDMPAGIAVDGTGSLTIAGTTTSTDFPLTAKTAVSGSSVFLTRLKPDGSGLIYSTIVPVSGAPGSLGVDAGGGAVLTMATPPYGFRLVRYSADGTLLFTRQGTGIGYAVATDGAGNIYSTGIAFRGNYAVKNSVATCGGPYLTVFSPAGEILQATWLPAGAGSRSTGLAVRPDSTVYIVGALLTSNVSVAVLTRLSPNPAAKSLPLGCLTDAAIFQIPGALPPNQGFYSNTPSGIAPGEIVSVFGSGLGPSNAVQPSVTTGTDFPTDLSSVQVRFDGQPAPLLYVQDSQINTIAPWSLIANNSTEVCVVYLGVQTNCLTIPVVESAPAVFTTDGYYAAAVNEDETINSATHPAPPGSVVSIFATGLGPVSPPPRDGAILDFPLPVNQFAVTANAVFVNGILGTRFLTYEVTYYGPAPVQPADLSQINLRVPESDSATLVIRDVYVHVGDVTAKFTIFVGRL